MSVSLAHGPYRVCCCVLLQLSELRLTADRVARDKSSLMSELQAVKDELEITNFMGKGSGGLRRL